MREWLRATGRTLLGVLLVAHGLGHAVVPLRGGMGLEPPISGLVVVLYTTAMLGFVAAGLGVLGARPFSSWISAAAGTAAVASVTVLVLLPAFDLWPGVILSVAFAIYAAGAALPHDATVRGRFARALGDGAALVVFGYIAVATVMFPWHRTWGVTDAERVATLPGDREPRTPALEVMHAVTIQAPPEAVWPWLVQIGQDRAGFYSYEWLERLFLADIHNVDEIRPEWQQRRAGDFVRATQPDYLGGILGPDLGWFVTEVQPERALVLHQWGAFVLLDDGRGGTRLIVRSTMSHPQVPVWAAALTFTAFELPHFIMERRMLLGIKDRAERSRRVNIG